MAIKAIFHLLADEYAVKSGETILQGQFVALDSDGLVVKATSSTAVIGIAGDTKSTSTASSLYTADVVINPSGDTRKTVNRISDMYDETAASGKMTVYHSGGTFATDMVESDIVNATPGDPLYVSANGKLQHTSSGSVVATFVSYGPLESGIVGTDVNGSMSLGNYATFILKI